MTDPATTIREAQLERIYRAFSYVPLNLYDEVQKLGEIAVGELLAALTELEQQLAKATVDRDRWAGEMRQPGVNVTTKPPAGA